MMELFPTELLVRVLRSTPEQLAALERVYDYRGEAEVFDATRAASLAGALEAEFVFSRAGRQWRVVFAGGDAFLLEDTLGARYLDYLLHHPNRPISALDLEVVIRPEKGELRTRNSAQPGADPEAVRAYLRELNRLRAEKEAAEEAGNLLEAEQLQGDIEAVEAALKRSGRSQDNGERARSNVRKAIGAVVRKLMRGNAPERAFGEHVRQQVSTGHECMYSQAEGRIWE